MEFQEFMKQKHRMCKGRNCGNCDLYIDNNKCNVSCIDIAEAYPEEAEAIIQKWCDEHPEHKIITLDEAIRHCEEKSGCNECGKEHEQLAIWLKELRTLKGMDEPTVTNAGKFREVFGDGNFKSTICYFTCGRTPCSDCAWWNEEYQPPESEE